MTGIIVIRSSFFKKGSLQSRLPLRGMYRFDVILVMSFSGLTPVSSRLKTLDASTELPAMSRSRVAKCEVSTVLLTAENRLASWRVGLAKRMDLA